MSDTRFTLPGVDDPASTEVGIILLGLDADRLLAGVGLAQLADDPTQVTLAVDQLRHGALLDLGQESLVESGIHRWRRIRTVLASAPPVPQTGSLRLMWQRTATMLTSAVADLGPASIAYLTACWLRRDEVDRRAEAHQP
jgi:hypothetical protein